MSGRRSAEAALERRCRLLVRAYPRGERPDEVLGTLLDTNEGRRAPHAADVASVLWHGLGARLGGTTAGTSYGAWGDAASVALVSSLVMFAGAAVALAARGWVPGVRRITYQGRVWHWQVEMFGDRREVYVATVAAAFAAGAAVAACLGRVRAARVLAVGTALAVAGASLAARAASPYSTTPFRASEGKVLGAAGLGAVAVVLLTGVVARAARLVPRWWWAPAGVVCVAAGLACTDMTWVPYLWGRSGPVLLTFAFAGPALMLLALPLVRRRAAVLAGTALVAVPVVPVALYLIQRRTWTSEWMWTALTVRSTQRVAVACAAGALVVVTTLRRAATPAVPEGEPGGET